MDLAADHWANTSDQGRQQLAAALLRQLPLGFELIGVDEFVLGSTRGTVASYRQHGRCFSFVPGGAFEIGWTPDLQDDDDLDAATVDDIKRNVRSRRLITMPPMLVETDAVELGWANADPADPQIKESIDELGLSGTETAFIVRGKSTQQVKRRADGSFEVRRGLNFVHADQTAALAQTGFRLATSDEWEYLCGAGAATLFRWGDAVPRNHYPLHASAAEAQWNLDSLLSEDKRVAPAGGFAPTFDLHRKPNSLGLRIAENPYYCELVAEPDQQRGGDGGSRICGGNGFFAGWLPLATAFFDEEICRRDPTAPFQVGYTCARRVLDLS
jgi:hypothetical protein